MLKGAFDILEIARPTQLAGSFGIAGPISNVLAFVALPVADHTFTEPIIVESVLLVLPFIEGSPERDINVLIGSGDIELTPQRKLSRTKFRIATGEVGSV